MLLNWPSKFDKLLMDDVLVIKAMALEHFAEVVARLHFLFESPFGVAVSEEELRLAYAWVATRSVKEAAHQERDRPASEQCEPPDCHKLAQDL